MNFAMSTLCGAGLPSVQRRVGLTGPIASGKSTVAEMLRNLGADVIDADAVYRSLVRPNSPLLERLVAQFGRQILSENGEIDRKRLGQIVFGDELALADLDRLTHPAVVAEIHEQMKRSTHAVIVVEAIKLVESGLAGAMDQIWYVTADLDVRVQRLRHRNGLDLPTAQTRVAVTDRPPPTTIRPGVTIDSSGSIEELHDDVTRAWQAFMTSECGIQYSIKRKTREMQCPTN